MRKKFCKKLEGGSGISSYDRKLEKYSLRGAFRESGELRLSGGAGLSSYDRKLKYRKR